MTRGMVGDRSLEQEVELERLASIVASSQDAIISKSLDGIVRTWNAGATKIFGYTPEEIIGKPITTVIPDELRSEETEILAKLRRGERIEHFDTVRVAKDGRRIDISLTVSPLRNKKGEIVGASKVARDVTERKHAEALQRLLIDELNHRVKNTLAIVQSLASQSLAHTNSPERFLATFSGRLQALSNAHDLLVRERMQGIQLHELIRSQLSPDCAGPEDIQISGANVTIRGTLVTHLALVLHELATNARKYGALAAPGGQLNIRWNRKPGTSNILALTWQETGLSGIVAPETTGFGTQLITRTLSSNGGTASLEYLPDGVCASIEFVVADGDDIGDAFQPETAGDPPSGPLPVSALEGLSILLVEDEAIVAMDLELKLEQLGLDVAGPASSVNEAGDLLQRIRPDIALLDANLHGQKVDGIAETLAAMSVPFAFSTGYGREALPAAFDDIEILAKPFSDARLLAVLSRLAAEALARRTGKTAETGTLPARKFGV